MLVVSKLQILLELLIGSWTPHKCYKSRLDGYDGDLNVHEAKNTTLR